MALRMAQAIGRRTLPAALAMASLWTAACATTKETTKETANDAQAGDKPASPTAAIGRGPEGGASIASLRVRDAASGLQYDAVGRPVEGAPERLVPIAGYNQFWFAWSIFNHGSAVFGRDEPVRTAPIESASGECGVPCEQIEMGCPGKDCIPALTRPKQVPPDAAEAKYLEDRAFVVGVEIGGQARAYPHNILWWHEIVNDEVAGHPIAITHCPLTFSTLAHDPGQFSGGGAVELGVSGRLYNSNLVFYDRTDESWYSQLLGRAIKGPAIGRDAPRVHVFEMTWSAWRALHPDSTVLSSDTGHGPNYGVYPYGSYFTDDRDTFGPTVPAPDPAFGAKAKTYGVRTGGSAKAYVHSELASFAARRHGEGAPPREVVNDTIGTTKLAVVFDLDAGYVQAFDRTGRADLELVR